MSKFEAAHVSISYTMRRTQKPLLAVNDVSFRMSEGEFVAIVGPSGCGKTSLLNAMAGLLPLAHGEIRLDGRAIQGPGSERAMVFQTPALLPWRTVMRNVVYGLELQGVNGRDARARAQQYIDLVGLRGFEESYPHELSGGMQQRVNLARALTVQPQVLLFDEPLSALDAQTREAMQFELQRIWLQQRITAVYVTHQIQEAIFLADKVIVMTPSPGRIKAVIPVDLPRPRPLRIQRTPVFVEIEDRIWGLLEASAGVGQSVQTD
ncbi:MAG: ABC transporter ATP-binding protein [Caldilineaceae bacterium]|nr:ABC transporter ATP-binding protein [Caldilineaceae bacterium]